MRRLLAIGIAVLAIAACGGDSGTSPPTNVDLTGTWSVTVSPIHGSVVTCTITGLTVQVVHSDSVLTGTYSATDMICNGTHRGPGSGVLVNGTDDAGVVYLELDSQDFALTGRVKSTNKVSGTYVVTLHLGSTDITDTGTWTATR